MKKFNDWFLALSAVAALACALPALVRLITAKPERTPFTLYSCTVHDFTSLYQDDGRDYSFVDRAGNIHGDEAQPLFYASILASKGALPDTLEGRAVTLEEIERNNLILSTDPRDVNKSVPPVYPLMESVPERLELQDPEEAVVSRKEALYIYHMGNRALDAEKTEQLNDGLREQGFVFPARLVDGNPTDRKDHDEGYLLTDARNRLFHFKQENGQIQVEHFTAADDLNVKFLKITEFENRATLGMLVTGEGQMAFLRPDGTVTVTEVSFDPEKEDLLIVGDLFYYTVKTATAAGEHFWALRSSDFSLVDSMDRPYERHWTLPSLRFTSPVDSHVKPRLTGFQE